ncbi:Chaperone J-domain superfamily [Forsythia ovata]|uniref:Chaperone J-domain superfamily n=1 Tax=Forsythia ovata TaxID=205694 RepID=A0ABD1WT63_9LAMI
MEAMEAAAGDGCCASRVAGSCWFGCLKPSIFPIKSLASDSEVKEAYMRLSILYHLDKNPDPAGGGSYHPVRGKDHGEDRWFLGARKHAFSLLISQTYRSDSNKVLGNNDTTSRREVSEIGECVGREDAGEFGEDGDGIEDEEMFSIFTEKVLPSGGETPPSALCLEFSRTTPARSRLYATAAGPMTLCRG